jgi:hypothetical protein
MGGKKNPITQKSNPMIVPWNQLVCMVISENTTTNSLHIVQQNLPEYTKILKKTQTGMLIGYHHIDM